VRALGDAVPFLGFEPLNVSQSVYLSAAIY